MDGFDIAAAQAQISGNAGYLGETIKIDGVTYPCVSGLAQKDSHFRQQGGEMVNISATVTVSNSDLPVPPEQWTLCEFRGMRLKIVGVEPGNLVTNLQLGYEFSL